MIVCLAPLPLTQSLSYPKRCPGQRSQAATANAMRPRVSKNIPTRDETAGQRTLVKRRRGEATRSVPSSSPFLLLLSSPRHLYPPSMRNCRILLRPYSCRLPMGRWRRLGRPLMRFAYFFLCLPTIYYCKHRSGTIPRSSGGIWSAGRSHSGSRGRTVPEVDTRSWIML